MKRLSLVLALFALPFALGCAPKSEDVSNSRQDESRVKPGGTVTSTRNPGAGVQRDLPGNRVTAQTPVIQVSLSGYQIEMPDTIPAGPQELLIINHGEEPHGFAVRGDGFDQTVVGNISKGEQQSAHLDLHPGQYEAYCPVDGHRAKGMSRTFTVR